MQVASWGKEALHIVVGIARTKHNVDSSSGQTTVLSRDLDEYFISPHVLIVEVLVSVSAFGHINSIGLAGLSNETCPACPTNVVVVGQAPCDD